MSPEELRRRCELLLDEITGADSADDAVDAMIAVFIEVQAAGLTPDERRDLAAIYGYEAGIEVSNIRRLLDRHGVREADRQGVVRSTVAMVEDALVGGRSRPTTPPREFPRERDHPKP